LFYICSGNSGLLFSSFNVKSLQCVDIGGDVCYIVMCVGSHSFHLVNIDIDIYLLLYPLGWTVSSVSLTLCARGPGFNSQPSIIGEQNRKYLFRHCPSVLRHQAVEVGTSCQDREVNWCVAWCTGVSQVDLALASGLWCVRRSVPRQLSS